MTEKEIQAMFDRANDGQLFPVGVPLAIVGSTSLDTSLEAHALIKLSLDRYKPTVVISGGAKGIDRMAAHAARLHGIVVDERYPPAGCEAWSKDRRWNKGYKPRNIEIAVLCQALIRIASKSSKTYGSGWTRDYAKKLGKPTLEFLLP